MQQFQAYAHALLRIVAGFVFSQHGMQKLFGLMGGVNGQGASVPLASLYGAAGVIELVCGVLILLGLFTRPVSFIASGEMAVAYFMSHFPRSFWTAQNGGDPAVLNCFIFLYFAAAGAGIWSLDALMQKKPSAQNKTAAASGA
jgi:putative oxidoreductase